MSQSGTATPRLLCRLGGMVLLIQGVKHLAPSLPWWGVSLAFLGAAAAVEWGYTGRIAP